MGSSMVLDTGQTATGEEKSERAYETFTDLSSKLSLTVKLITQSDCLKWSIQESNLL